MLFAVDAVGDICVSIYLSGFSRLDLKTEILRTPRATKK